MPLWKPIEVWYRAPESRRESRFGQPADVFSLGTVLMDLLRVLRPLPGDKYHFRYFSFTVRHACCTNPD